MSWRGILSEQTPSCAEWLENELCKLPMVDITPAQVLYHLRMAHLQLWVYGQHEFMLITEIVHRPNTTILLLRFGAGKLSRRLLQEGRAVVIPWAKSYGCEQVEVAGRAGWQRVLDLKPLVTLYRGEL